MSQFEITELKKAFMVFDSNDDGVISFQELQQAFVNLNKNLSTDELKIMVRFSKYIYI